MYFICLDDDSETATEGEEELRARELRKQEVHLDVPDRNSDSGSDTEVKNVKNCTKSNPFNNESTYEFSLAQLELNNDFSKSLQKNDHSTDTRNTNTMSQLHLYIPVEGAVNELPDNSLFVTPTSSACCDSVNSSIIDYNKLVLEQQQQHNLDSFNGSVKSASILNTACNNTVLCKGSGDICEQIKAPPRNKGKKKSILIPSDLEVDAVAKTLARRISLGTEPDSAHNVKHPLLKISDNHKTKEKSDLQTCKAYTQNFVKPHNLSRNVTEVNTGCSLRNNYSRLTSVGTSVEFVSDSKLAIAKSVQNEENKSKGNTKSSASNKEVIYSQKDKRKIERYRKDCCVM